MHASFLILALGLAASARPMRRQNAFDVANGEEALALNAQFATLTPDSPCTAPQDACVNDQFAQCVGDRFVLQPCAGGTICAALPLVNSPGTSITCTTQADRDARIAATGATGAGNGGGANDDAANDDAANDDAAGDDAANDNAGDNDAADDDDNNNAGDGGAAGNDGAADEDPQTSLTLNPAVIAQNFALDGREEGKADTPSLTSVNNFINFCLTVDAEITNGKQNEAGSCNPAPIGHIPAKGNMPSSKFIFPPNGGTVPAGQSFTVQMAINKLVTGNFVNAQNSYFAAPQQLQGGIIVGHSHVVIELLDSVDQTTPTDPEFFAFFKGLNGVAENGILTADAEDGLQAGAYRMCSINAAANHQPVIVPVAQHGALDDCVYFTVV